MEACSRVSLSERGGSGLVAMVIRHCTNSTMIQELWLRIRKNATYVGKLPCTKNTGTIIATHANIKLDESFKYANSQEWLLSKRERRVEHRHAINPGSS